MATQRDSIGNNLETIRTLLGIEAPAQDTESLDSDFAWYVGSTGNNEDGEWQDFSDEYIAQGIWINGYDDKYTDLVRAIQVGDRIALKSMFNQKYNLPFDANGRKVGAMKIKAIGIVTENSGDGKHIRVEWTKFDTPKTWYGPGSLWNTIHLVKASDGFIKKALLDFTFHDIPQDYSLCVEKYSDDTTTEQIVETDELDTNTIDESTRIEGGTNVLLYGVPGSGKSWTIAHEYCTPETMVERVVFHPDYTNADFVGQILPIVDPEDKMVTYDFTPGPFTTILREAYQNPTKEYVLVIEEINRGNAPAIFGDIFQLLDRAYESFTEGGITYKAGTSAYGITNKSVAKVVYGDETAKVRIPSNLSIYGTMNTSDQNVFTLDTAFQRRWRMRLIENNFDNVRASLANAQILDTGVVWSKFCDIINAQIIGNKAKVASSEDKRLGVYFIHETDLEFDANAVPSEGYTDLYREYIDLLNAERDKTITSDKAQRLKELRAAIIKVRVFPEKVIKYLWDDAFKFNPEVIFDTENMDCLEKVIRTFVFNTGNDRLKVFKPHIRNLLNGN